jgi:hypothetical protein
MSSQAVARERTRAVAEEMADAVSGWWRRFCSPVGGGEVEVSMGVLGMDRIGELTA